MRSCLLLVMLGFVPQAPGQTLVSGWELESIHGPSQFGIADSLALDFDQDGLVDVVSVSIDDGQLRAYINQGDFQFEQQIIHTDVSGAFRLLATDLNQDGGIDFVIPSICSQQLMALLHPPTGYQQQILAEGV